MRGEIAEYQRRIEAVPGLESEWVALTRDYDTQQQAYKELLAKSTAAQVAAQFEQNCPEINDLMARMENTQQWTRHHDFVASRMRQFLPASEPGDPRARDTWSPREGVLPRRALPLLFRESGRG